MENKPQRFDGIKRRPKGSSRPVRPRTKLKSQRISINKKRTASGPSSKKTHKALLKRSVPVQRSRDLGSRSVSRLSSQWRPILRIFVPAVLGLFAAIGFINQFDSARLRIEPHRELAHIQTTIIAQRDALPEELGFSIIALSEKSELTLEPDSEIQAREKASGTVKIFNDFSSSPQRLAPETRFQAVDGKIFRIGNEEVIIPGKKGNIPGEISADVYADQAGAEYNIDVTDFSIPGFLELGLNDKYAGMYALSTKKFSGGFSGSRPSISGGLKEAQTKDLESKIQTMLQERILSEKTPEMLLVQNSASIVFKEPVFVADDEQEGVLSVTGTMYALLLNKEELGSYLAQRELELQEGATVELSSDTKLVPIYRGGDVDYQSIQKADIEIDNQVLYIWNVDQQRVAADFATVFKDAVPNLIEGMQSIGSINIRNHPRWRKTLPANPEDIKIKIVK